MGRTTLPLGAYGAPLRGNDGDTLYFDAATGEWYTAPAASGGGPPLTGVYYVDATTSVPLADQDGSIAAPFAELQQALDTLGVSTIYLTPGAAYSGTIPDAEEPVTIAIMALSTFTFQQTPRPVVSINAGEDVNLAFVGCEISTIAGALRSVTTYNCNVGEIGTELAPLENCTCVFLADEEQAANYGVGPVFALSARAEGVSLTDMTLDEGETVGTAILNRCRVSPGSALDINVTNVRADLYTLASIQSGGSTLALGESTELNCLDAPTTDLPDTAFAGGTDEVVNVNLVVPGARPGDTFAIACDDPDAGILLGQAFSALADQVTLPVACIGAVGATALDLRVTRFSVSYATET